MSATTLQGSSTHDAEAPTGTTLAWGPSKYDVVTAAVSFSNVTGLVAGFALSSVVLAYSVVATASLKTGQRIDVSFAGALFVLSFVSCIMCAYSFGALSGRENSRASMTTATLLGSTLPVTFVAVIGGFRALARAFLPSSAEMLLCLAYFVVVVGQLRAWFPLVEIRHDDSRAWRSLIYLVIGAAIVDLVAIVIRHVGFVGQPATWQYVATVAVGMFYTTVSTLGGLLISLGITPGAGKKSLVGRIIRDEVLTKSARWFIAILQYATLLTLLVLLP